MRESDFAERKNRKFMKKEMRRKASSAFFRFFPQMGIFTFTKTGISCKIEISIKMRGCEALHAALRLCEILETEG